MDHKGFTLAELLIALLLSAIAVSTAAGLFSTAGMGIDVLERRSSSHEARMNARRWVEELMLGVEVGRQRPFEGSDDLIEFSSRTWNSHGWTEPVWVSIGVDDARLVATTSSGMSHLIAEVVGEVWFDYWVAVGTTRAWVREWSSQTNPPLAVRLRFTHEAGVQDTVHLYIGER